MVQHLFDVYLWAQVLKLWLFVLYAVVVLTVEKVLRSVVYVASVFIPIAVIDWVRARITSVPRLVRGFKDEEENAPKEVNFDTPELITSRGYAFEEHYAETPDGFRLAMHRIPPRRPAAAAGAAGSGPAAPAPVVYVMHGFLQSSECFVASERGLGFALANAGCDVWLGNCRGNKYSCKHARLSPHSAEYWDFSMDQVAAHDLPTCLTYILAQTKAPKLSYVGFSQGTAVAFACFSQNPALAARVNCFLALAPATLATGFSNKLLDSLAKLSPDIVYLIFGRTALLSTCLFWQNLLSTKLYCSVIDRSCEFLFGWDMANIARDDKPLLYSHIYSYSSVKSVVHWFQLMRSKRFQVYDDAKWKGPQTSYSYSGQRLPGYPINQITCPIALFYGGRDFLVDTPSLLRNLPPGTFQHEEPSYEHMDFLYARNAQVRIYDKLIALIRLASAASAAGAEGVTSAQLSAELQLALQLQQQQQQQVNSTAAGAGVSGFALGADTAAAGLAIGLAVPRPSPSPSPSPSASPAPLLGGATASAVVTAVSDAATPTPGDDEPRSAGSAASAGAAALAVASPVPVAARAGGRNRNRNNKQQRGAAADEPLPEHKA